VLCTVQTACNETPIMICLVAGIDAVTAFGCRVVHVGSLIPLKR